MRLLGSLTAVPVIFAVYVAGQHGYLCSDAEGNTNTTYDQAFVEKSLTDACFPDSELSAAELAANSAAGKYPQVWVDSEDYGFNGTVLLWKFQGNSTESQEKPDVLVFSNKACNNLGLLQRSGDQLKICQSIDEEDNEKASLDSPSKKPRPGIFSGEWANNDAFPGRGDSPDDAIDMSQYNGGSYNQYRNRGYEQSSSSRNSGKRGSGNSSKGVSRLFRSLSSSRSGGPPTRDPPPPSRSRGPPTRDPPPPPGPPEGYGGPHQGYGGPQGYGVPPQGYGFPPEGGYIDPGSYRLESMMNLYPAPPGELHGSTLYDPTTFDDGID